MQQIYELYIFSPKNKCIFFLDLQKEEKFIYSWKKITDVLNIVQSIKYFSELLMNDN
jgi:hypothetical protein